MTVVKETECLLTELCAIEWSNTAGASECVWMKTVPACKGIHSVRTLGVIHKGRPDSLEVGKKLSDL